MSYSNFYMNVATGSNLNSGSTPGATVYSSLTGNWDGTSIFTPTDSSTPAGVVLVNDWVSIYPNAASATPYIAQVTAVAAGVNGAITCSTTAKFGTAPTSGSGTRNLIDGGPWLDFGMVASGVALNTGVVSQDTQINIKAGTYASTVGRACALAGSTTVMLLFQGYQTTIGDQIGNQAAVAGTNIPLLTNTAAVSFSGAGVKLSCLHFTSSLASSTAFTLSGGNVIASNCRFISTATSTVCLSTTVATVNLASCYVQAPATGTAQVLSISATTNMVGCVIVGGVVQLIATSGGTLMAKDCLFINCGSDAIKTAAALYALNCSFYNATGNGINLTTVSTDVLIENCYFSTIATSGKAAINNTSGTNTTQVALVNNGYFNCANNILGVQETYTVFDKGTLGSEAFANPGSGNFGIVAAFQGIGFPGNFENFSTSASSRDIGAVQTAAGGGGYQPRPFQVGM